MYSYNFPYFMNNGLRILYPSALDDTRLHLLCKEARCMLAESPLLKDFNLRLIQLAWMDQLSKSTWFEVWRTYRGKHHSGLFLSNKLQLPHCQHSNMKHSRYRSTNSCSILILEHSEILICANHICECQRVFLSLQIGSGRESTQGGITTDWKQS